MCNQKSFDERVNFFASIAMITVVISNSAHAKIDIR